MNGCVCRYGHCGCDWPSDYAHPCGTCDCSCGQHHHEGEDQAMSNETTITITGNLVEDPELRFTPAGQPVARFRVASTPRYKDSATGEWKDGDSLFLTCNVWRQAAEHAAESLVKGTRVIIQGRLRQRSYTTKEGEKRTVYEVEVDECGPSLKNATAKVTKAARTNGEGSQAQDKADPWAGDEPPF